MYWGMFVPSKVNKVLECLKMGKTWERAFEEIRKIKTNASSKKK